MELIRWLGHTLLFFDGAMGTALQAAGLPAGQSPDIASLTMPDTVMDIHRAYLNAGANILKTNTFSTNAHRLAGTPHSVESVVSVGVALARDAIDSAVSDGVQGPHFVALDIGPSGRLLSPLGDLDFDDAVRLFAQVARAGRDAGADCVLIETIADLYEMKAAILAAREADLPILATVTAGEDGRLLTGADMETVAVTLDALGVSAIGLNCGFGAEALLPSLMRLRKGCSLPLILNANAGLPRQASGSTVYDEQPDAFAHAVEKAVSAGASLLGGCCGTTPEHIRALVDRLRGVSLPPSPEITHTVVTSGSRAVFIDGRAPVLIGERINPTGKPAMKRALRSGSMDYMLREAVRQQEAGVHILDVNVGLPGIDEAAALAALVPAVQAVSDLPVQIDTADPVALERALYFYNGKPLINSVTGKRDSMATVFPLVKRYGGVVVALTLDESGIPGDAEGRLAVARRIIEEAARHGIARRDIIVDPLVMAVSADPAAARVCLEAVRLIRGSLGVQTLLGISNVSFGLPEREALNATFFAMAAEAGLSAAIMNPYAVGMMRTYHALRALSGEDAGFEGYIAAMDGRQAVSAQADEPGKALKTQTLHQAIRQGLREDARQLACGLVSERDPLTIVASEIVPALNDIGEAFEKGQAFLPQLLMSAEAAKAAFEVLSEGLDRQSGGPGHPVVIATVEGDIHDIGKNIARAMLENYQFQVIDLGRDVAPEAVVEAALRHNARLVGLSALMTTTVVSMEKTIRLLRSSAPDCRIMVGGAVLTPEYARSIGADRHVRDAMDSVRYAQQVYAPEEKG